MPTAVGIIVLESRLQLLFREPQTGEPDLLDGAPAGLPFLCILGCKLLGSLSSGINLICTNPPSPSHYLLSKDSPEMRTPL